MKQQFRNVSIASAVVLSVLNLFGTSASAADETLRGAAGDKMLIGTAIMASDLADPGQAALISQQFDCITPGNEMKPDALQNVKGTFTFEKGDAIVAFAQAHDMKVVGHTLVWHNQSPAWLYADESGKPLPRDQALANMKDHITKVVQHYKGKIIGWDVVNEAISDKPAEYLSDTPAHKAIGDDYIVKAFQFAHEADPDAQLYYNDYNDEQPEKLAKCVRLLKELKDAGCRVDAVGIQGHWMMEWPPAQTIDDAIAAYEKLGVKVNVSELDIDVLPRNTTGAEITATEKSGIDSFKSGLPSELAQKQADRYRSFFEVFAKHPGAVARVTFWGTHDGTSWLNDWPVKGRTNHPLLFGRDLKPKPAFDAVIAALGASK